MTNSPASDERPARGSQPWIHRAFALGIPLSWLAGPIGVAALWPLSAAANTLHIGIALGTVLGLDALRRRRWTLAALLLIHVPLLALWWIPRLAPAAPSTAFQGAPDLRLAVWNLGSAVASPEEAVEWISAADADVVALCELNAKVARAVVAAVGERYPHRALYPLGVPGRGLLSRFPIRAEEFVYLEGARAHLCATLDVAGRDLALTVVHLDLKAAVLGHAEPSVRDLDVLVPELIGGPPGLLVGDFNASETSAVYRDLARGPLVDTFRERGAGLGFTFPIFGRYHGVPLPTFVRIDYVWRTPGLITRSARVADDGGGDHLPLLVELDLAD